MRGGNYGWTGDERCPPAFPSGAIAPVKTYTDTTTIAPSGASFYDASGIPEWTGSLARGSFPAGPGAGPADRHGRGVRRSGGDRYGTAATIVQRYWSSTSVGDAAATGSTICG